MMKRKVSNQLFVLGVMFFVIFSSMIYPDWDVLKNPKPNVIEKNYVKIEKIKTINSDLGNSHFIFFPSSWAIDSQNNHYIYDKSQALIFVLDKDFNYLHSFGGQGQGPGEFLRTRTAVSLKVGPDNKLFAYDDSSGKVLIFSLNGKFIKQVKREAWLPLNPVLDAKGECLDIKFHENGDLLLLNEFRKPNITLKLNKEDLYYLFEAPPKLFLKRINLSQFLSINNLKSKLLIYFSPSSTMFITENNRIVKKFQVIPESALKHLKYNLESGREKNTKDVVGYACIFIKLLIDEDSDDSFYLSYGVGVEDLMNTFYKVNTDGQLLKVLYKKCSATSYPVSFFVKKNGLFYGLENDELVIYKEKKNEN